MYNPSGSDIHTVRSFTLPEINKCCWVPNCLNIENTSCFKTFYPLPTDAILREIWLARVGKPIVSSVESIYLCEEHFKHNDLIDHISKGTTLIPYYKMSQVICRLCLSIVPEEQPYHVLSNNIPTDIPPDLKNTSQLAIVITPEPLQNIVKFCMPELIIQTEPIPLICQNCFKKIWKLFLFKLTCIEVDKRLRGDLSIETYGKMVLCRACPQTFGTNFIVLVEQSNSGMFLMNMFSTKYSSKVVPLRLCTNCYEKLEELLEFQMNCHAVEEKMKCHMALTKNQEIVRAQVISPLKPVNKTIWETKDSSTNKKSLIEVATNESSTNTNSFVMWNRIEFVKAMIKHGQPLKNKVEKIEKDEIWRNINQELQAKGIVCNVLGLKNTWGTMMADIQKAIKKKQSLNELQSLMIKYLKTDQHAGPVSSVQHQPLINNNIYESRSIGITPYLENTKYSFDFHLCQQTQCPSIIQEKSFNPYEQEMCRGPKIQLQILEENTSLGNNVSTETNANLETCPSFGTVPNNGSLVNSSMGTSNTRSFLSNTQDNNRSENYLIAPVSAKSRTANRLSNVLKPDINKKNISVHDRTDIPMNITAITDISESNTRNQERETVEITFSNEQQLQLLEMMKIEYIFYLKEVGNVYSKLPFKTLLARIIKHHKNYENYSLNTIHNCWRKMEESSLQNKNNVIKTVLQEEILEFLKFESQHRKPKALPKQPNKLFGYKKRKRKKRKYKRSEVVYQEKIDFVAAAQREYNALTNEEKTVRSIWKTLTGKVHKRGFKNWSHVKIYNFWSRLKISALVHEKNSDDLVDRDVWKLIQQFNSDKKSIQNNKHISENHKDTITTETSEKLDIGLKGDKNRSDPVATPIEHAQEVRDNPTTMQTVKLDKRIFNSGRTPIKKLVFPLTLSEKVDFLNKIDQEFNNNPDSWTNILSRLYRSRYKNWDKTKIFGVWNQLKVSSYITHENKKGGDIAEKRMWDLLQKSFQTQRKKTNSKMSSTSGCSTVKCGKDNLKEKSIPVDQQNADRAKLKKLSEAERLILFKNIKKEYLAMVNSKEQNIARPWKNTIQRVHEKYYKNILLEKKVLFEWTKMRKSATLHENTSNMTEIDWKVVRLLKLAKKIKECNTNSNKKETSHTEPKRKITQDDEIDNNSNNREELEEQKKDYVDWCYKKKLDLITTVKCYGRDVFKKSSDNEKDEFWLKIKTDFQKRGYKYSEESLRQRWEELHGSANMAWADQKVASELDDIIIKFMKSVIILKQGSDMCEKNKNIIEEPPMAEKLENNEPIRSVDKEQSINEASVEGSNEASEEGSNAASEEGSNEASEEGGNEASEEGSSEANEEGSDEDNEMLEEINDKYVSLEDIRNYIPVVLNNEIVELSSDDETVIDFALTTEEIKNVGVMIEKSKTTVEKEEIKKLKQLMENVGVVKNIQQERKISESLLNTKSHKAELVQPNMVEDCSVIVIESDDE